MLVSCPHCGAQVRAEPGQDRIPCSSCQRTFFAQSGYGTPPLAAARPPPSGGCIVIVVVLLVLAVPIVGGAVVSIVWLRARSSTRSSTTAPTPPKPSPPSPPEPSPPEPHATGLPIAPAPPSAPTAAAAVGAEIASLISQATTEARKVQERAVLTAVVAFKTKDGLADTSGESYVAMTFEYLYTDPTKPPGADKVSGMISVMARGGAFSVSHSPGWPVFERDLKPGFLRGALEVPRCTSDRMWKTAVSSGVPANAIADIHLYNNDTFTPKSPLVWSVRVDGHDELRREIDAHTCALASPRR